MNIVILDLEWNGSYSKKVHHYVNEIIEFGAVKVDENLNFLSEFSLLVKPEKAGFLNINYLTAKIWSNVDILILKAACWMIALILIGRLFEVIIYATIAPIPLATVAGEGWSESSKTFIKGFAAVCLQSVIIIVMFNAFSGITQLMTDLHSNLSITVTTLSLALGVAKSGQWARTAVGMG